MDQTNEPEDGGVSQRRIAVAGGTGCVGRLVVAAARQRGDDVVVISRATGVDVTTGAGLAEALRNVDVVIDVTNSPAFSARAAVGFFERETTNLLTAERAAGVGHHVALSIVGIDRVPTGYYAGKLRQKQLIEAGDRPWTILRATQFHEFAAQLRQRAAIGPLVLVPRMRSATVAARDVAEELVRLAGAPPSGRAVDLVGPEVLEMTDLCVG
jgi:uncharacterized protein YbjT (DUF2867 family)